MKKLLYLVMAAIVLMACEKNGGKDVNLPDQDKKALEHLCSAAKFLNQTEDQLNKTFKEAGFKEYPYTPGEYAPGMEAPASDELTYVHYCYNAPDVAGWTGYIESEEQHKAYNQILKAGKVYINVVITYYNGKFYKIDGTFHVDSSIEGVNQIYLVASNIAYDVLPTSDDGYKNWSGGLGDLEAMRTDKPKYYDTDQRAAFVADFSASQIVSANEVGSTQKGDQNIFQYNLTWSNELAGTQEAEYMNATGYVVPAYGFIYAGAF